MSRDLMRGVRKVVLTLLGLVLLGGAYFVYRLGWGTPFSLDHLATRQAVFYLLERPELLTTLGFVDGTLLDFHSGELEEFSVAARDRRYAQAEKFLVELERYDRARLSMHDRLTHEAQVAFITAPAKLKRFEWLTADDSGPYPFSPSGMQVSLPQFLLRSHTITNEKTARSWVRRLEQVGRKIDEGVAEVRRQAAASVTPPVEILDRTIESTKVFKQPTAEQHPLIVHLSKRLEALGDDIDADDAERFRSRALSALTDRVYPAYARLEATLGELRPLAAKNPAAGVIRLPQGLEYYSVMLRQHTTTDLTPQQVHELGLREVGRHTSELDVRLKAIGLSAGPVGERLASLNADPRYHFENSDAGREVVLTRFRTILTELDQRIPEYFFDRPPQPLEVQRAPKEIEDVESVASFLPAAMDGSRPGIFFANLRDPREMPTWMMKTIAYHEGIPGHYFQISIVQKQKNLPLVRQQPAFTAYVEGWGLYAEQLAAEMGAYRDDPQGDVGRLQWALVRAVRLVIDTGMHAQGWTYDQAVDYMAGTTGYSRSATASEIERYTAFPGQACAYTLGALKILELRERAKTALGARFDIRAFHDVVLKTGSVPLTSLDAVVDEWIASRSVNT